MKALKTEGTRCFSISVHNPIKAKSRSATASSRSEQSNLEDVPKLYHNFADVFSKTKADTLAPHREYDLKIEINKTAKALSGDRLC